MTDVVDALRDVVAPDAIRPGGCPRAGAAVVVAPRTIDEIAGALALATRRRWSTRVAGAGTWLAPPAPELVVSAARLDAAAAYTPGDLTISVGAGMTHDGLARITAAQGQWLALDPPGRPEATLGATFATASAGPLRFGHGTPRDHVLGLELVTGDGRILRFGGNVMKNVAGYDVVRLLVGSRGSLGLITTLHLRLRALPEHDATLAITADHWPALVERARQLRAMRFAAVAIELVAPAFWHAPPAELAGRWALLVRFHGNRDSVEAARAEVGASAIELDGAQIWPALAAREAAAETIVRLADRPSELGATLALACELSPSAALAAHAGDGIVRLVADPAIDLAAARARTRGTVRVDGSRLVSDARMAAIVRIFDPASILAGDA